MEPSANMSALERFRQSNRGLHQRQRQRAPRIPGQTHGWHPTGATVHLTQPLHGGGHPHVVRYRHAFRSCPASNSWSGRRNAGCLTWRAVTPRGRAREVAGAMLPTARTAKLLGSNGSARQGQVDNLRILTGTSWKTERKVAGQCSPSGERLPEVLARSNRSTECLDLAADDVHLSGCCQPLELLLREPGRVGRHRVGAHSGRPAYSTEGKPYAIRPTFTS